MGNKFFNQLNRAANLTTTENGAIAYKDKVLNPIVKWTYNISDNRRNIVDLKIRNEDEISKRNSIIDTELSNEIIYEAEKIMNDDLSSNITLDTIARLITYYRDPRKGLGERSLFRTVLSRLIEKNIFTPSNINNFCNAVVDYGRWDDLISIYFELFVYASHNVNCGLHNILIDINKHIRDQLEKDCNNLVDKNGNVSLLAKWLPSINSSSKISRMEALHFINTWKINKRMYRKALSNLRAYINVVERNICQNHYEDINYSNVPSLAMSLYKDKFLINDGDRFDKFIDDVKSGKTKINASVITPVELASKFRNEVYNRLEHYWDKPKKFNDSIADDVLEEMWKALPSVNVSGNVLPVCDVSGSMYSSVTSTIDSIDISIGMGAYISEHNTGIFKDKVINFADYPTVLDLSDAKTVCEKLYRIETMHDGFSTNVESVLKLVLDMAIKGGCSQGDIPTLLFITDCEFNSITTDSSSIDTLFESYKEIYKKNGYELPKVVFWNTQNRSRTVPLTQNKNGLILLSGFSPNILNMVKENNMDPLQSILNEINSEWLDNSKYLYC